MVKGGVLRLNNYFVCGNSWGRVRGLTDWTGRTMVKAGPASPAEVVGFKTRVPNTATIKTLLLE